MHGDPLKNSNRRDHYYHTLFERQRNEIHDNHRSALRSLSNLSLRLGMIFNDANFFGLMD